MLGGQEQKTKEVMAAVEISQAPGPLRWPVYAARQNPGLPPSLLPPAVPVSGIRNICFMPEDLLPEVVSSRGSSLSLSSKAILGGNETVPPYREVGWGTGGSNMSKTS